MRLSKQEEFTMTYLEIKERMVDDKEKGVEAICLAKTYNDNVRCFRNRWN